ncbi:MAG: glycosyltransferase family 39 protein, partial [Planctomycetota bacterium]
MHGSAEETRHRLWGRPLLLLVLLAVLVRMLVATGMPIINSDAGVYIEAASKYLSGDWQAALKGRMVHPLYPVLLAGAWAVVGDAWLAGAVVSIVCAAVALIALYGLAFEGWGRRAAGFTALVYALHPIFSGMEARVLPQATYHMCAFWAVYCLWRGIRGGSWRWGMGAGLCLGGAYLARTEGVLLVAACFGAGFLFLPARAYRRSWKPLAAALAILLLGASPYLIWLRVQFGTWIPSGRAAVRKAVPDAQPVYPKWMDEEDRKELAETGPVERWGGATYHVGRKMLNMICPGAGILLGLAVLFFRRGSGGRAAGPLLLMLALATSLGVLFYVALYSGGASNRYLAFPIGMLLPWAGWGFHRLTEWADGLRWRGAAAAAALVLCGGMAFRAMEFHHPERIVVREAADWLGENGGRGKRIVATRDAAAYHAGG